MVTSIAGDISNPLIQLVIWFPRGHIYFLQAQVKSVPCDTRTPCPGGLQRSASSPRTTSFLKSPEELFEESMLCSSWPKR